MIGLVPHLKIYACTQPTDMRKGFDRLSGIVANLLAEDPLGGHLFLFRNRTREELLHRTSSSIPEGVARRAHICMSGDASVKDRTDEAR
ncbi:MAG: IS66 family insertion sequence element accessory protein TnpB [Pirellulaceae bacterium]